MMNIHCGTLWSEKYPLETDKTLICKDYLRKHQASRLKIDFKILSPLSVSNNTKIPLPWSSSQLKVKLLYIFRRT